MWEISWLLESLYWIQNSAKDEYLGDTVKVIVKFGKIIQCIRQGVSRKMHGGPSSEPLKLLSVFDYGERGWAREGACVKVK